MIVGNREKLFVCGGWWNKHKSKTCCLYDFGMQQWTDLKNMNHTHCCGGICKWKERGNKLIVAGGWQTEHNEVEEYDMNKNIWIDLPNLNTKHEYYPAVLTVNNILFCIGGVHEGGNTLGCIEFYDQRDSANKWMYVESVEKYFDLPQQGGAGFNCFLPF